MVTRFGSNKIWKKNQSKKKVAKDLYGPLGHIQFPDAF